MVPPYSNAVPVMVRVTSTAEDAASAFEVAADPTEARRNSVSHPRQQVTGEASDVVDAAHPRVP